MDKKPVLPVQKAPEVKKKPTFAYQLEEKSGGYQIYLFTLDAANAVLKRERISDPDGWAETIGTLEQELSKLFA